MICCCSLAGTAACKTCWHNPDSTKQYNNFISWDTCFYNPDSTNKMINERTCHNKSLDGFLCSLCSFGDFASFNFKPNYCPNCGAKVVSE